MSGCCYDCFVCCCCVLRRPVGPAVGTPEWFLKQQLAAADLGALLAAPTYNSLMDAQRLFDDTTMVPSCATYLNGLLPLHALAKSTKPEFKWTADYLQPTDSTGWIRNCRIDLYPKIVAAGPRSAINDRTTDADGLTPLQVWLL